MDSELIQEKVEKRIKWTERYANESRFENIESPFRILIYFIAELINSKALAASKINWEKNWLLIGKLLSIYFIERRPRTICNFAKIEFVSFITELSESSSTFFVITRRYILLDSRNLQLHGNIWPIASMLNLFLLKKKSQNRELAHSPQGFNHTRLWFAFAIRSSVIRSSGNFFLGSVYHVQFRS